MKSGTLNLEPSGPHRACYGTPLSLLLPYYDFVIKAWNNSISNKGLLKDCDKEENVAVTGAATASFFQKKTVERSVQCHVFAQLPKEDRKTFCPVSRIRPVTKRRL